MHAVARLVFFGVYRQHPGFLGSRWGARAYWPALTPGVNDLGGTLMNESITRAAGAAHGQEWSPTDIEALIADAGPVVANAHHALRRRRSRPANKGIQCPRAG